MSWTGWPASIGTDVQDFAWLRQLWEAVRERRWCYGEHGPIWPPPNNVPEFGSGTVSSLTDNGDGTWTLSDSSKALPPSGNSDDGTWWDGRQRPSGCTGDYWEGVNCSAEPPDMPYVHSQWDVIIQYDNGAAEWYRDQEPWHVVRGRLISSTSRTLTFRCLLDNYVTANCIPSTSSLETKKYYLIKRNGLWWADKEFDLGRYPDWPNDNELFRGTVSAGKIFDDGTGYLRDSVTPEAQTWNPATAELWVDKQVLVYDSTGVLHRLSITGNACGTLLFGGLAAVPDDETGLTVESEITGTYTIVNLDGRGFPGRDAWPTLWHYGGAWASTETHDPSDARVSRDKAFAVGRLEWEQLEDDSVIHCGDEDSIFKIEHALDVDAWSSSINQCKPADHCFTPQLYKTLRCIQVSIEGLVPNFVRPVSYADAADIPAYSIAKCFNDCGINSGASSVTSETVGTVVTYYFTVASEYRGYPIFYELTGSDGRQLSVDDLTTFPAAPADATTGRVVVRTIDTAHTADDGSYAGSTVVYSAGWTRYHPLEFTHMHGRGAFIPDLQNGSPKYGPGVINFCGPGPGCNHDCHGVGVWHWQEPTIGPKIYDDYGEAGDDNANPFTAGDVARYSGNTWQDPGTHPTGEPGQAKYFDRFYEGQHRPDLQVKLYESSRGHVTSATDYSFTDDSKSWWDYWYPGNDSGTMRTESGIATGGGTSTLVTTTALTDATNPASCWWGTDRFVGTIFLKDNEIRPYLNFILEIDKLEQQLADGGEAKYAGDGTETVIGTYVAGEPMEDLDGDPIMVTNTYKTVINDVTNTTAGNAPVLHFSATMTLAGDALAVANGDAWRIKEPATNLHRWRGRRVRFTRDDGTQFELELTHNDDRTVFFARQTDPTKKPQVGWHYEIIEYDTGGCWKWQTTEPTDAEKANGIRWQKVVYNYLDVDEEVQMMTGYWVEPTGTDSRGQPWHKNGAENLPHKSAKKFGRIIKGDYIHLTTYNEMYAMLNRLVWTKSTNGTYSNWKDPDVPENYIMTAGSGPNDGPEAAQNTMPDFEFTTDDSTWRTWIMNPDNDYEGPPGLSDGGSYMTGLSRPSGHAHSDTHDAAFGDIFADVKTEWWKAAIPAGSELLSYKTDVYVRATFGDIHTGWTNDGGAHDWHKTTVEFAPGGSGLVKDKWEVVGSLGIDVNNDPNDGKVKVGGSLTLPPFGPLLDMRNNMTDDGTFVGPGGAGATQYHTGESVSTGWEVNGETNIYKWNVTGGLRYVSFTS